MILAAAAGAEIYARGWFRGEQLRGDLDAAEYGVAVEGGDEVAALDAGFPGRAVRRDLEDEQAGVVGQSDGLSPGSGEVGGFESETERGCGVVGCGLEVCEQTPQQVSEESAFVRAQCG